MVVMVGGVLGGGGVTGGRGGGGGEMEWRLFIICDIQV